MNGCAIFAIEYDETLTIYRKAGWNIYSIRVLCKLIDCEEEARDIEYFWWGEDKPPAEVYTKELSYLTPAKEIKDTLKEYSIYCK